MLKIQCIAFLTLALIVSSTCLAAPYDKPSPEVFAVLSASQKYVKNETKIAIPKYRIENIVDDWARVYVIPSGKEADPAYLFLQKADGEWKGVTIGTAFTPDDYKSFKIPEAIWIK